MLDSHFYDTPVVAYNDESYKIYDSRKAASDSIAKKRGCSPTTADKSIRDAIYRKEIHYGYRWEYMK